MDPLCPAVRLLSANRGLSTTLSSPASRQNRHHQGPQQRKSNPAHHPPRQPQLNQRTKTKSNRAPLPPTACTCEYADSRNPQDASVQPIPYLPPGTLARVPGAPRPQRGGALQCCPQHNAVPMMKAGAQPNSRCGGKWPPQARLSTEGPEQARPPNRRREGSGEGVGGTQNRRAKTRAVWDAGTARLGPLYDRPAVGARRVPPPASSPGVPRHLIERQGCLPGDLGSAQRPYALRDAVGLVQFSLPYALLSLRAASSLLTEEFCL